MCINREAGLLTNRQELVGCGHFHLVFGFLVFSYLKAAVETAIFGFGHNAVIAQRRLRRNLELTAECAATRQRELLCKNTGVVRIFDGHIYCVTCAWLVTSMFVN